MKCVCGGEAIFAGDACHCVTCVICGQRAHGGSGWWACVIGDEHVCRGRCWRKYEAERLEKIALDHWLSMFRIWNTELLSGSR